MSSDDKNNRRERPLNFFQRRGRAGAGDLSCPWWNVYKSNLDYNVGFERGWQRRGRRQRGGREVCASTTRWTTCFHDGPTTTRNCIKRHKGAIKFLFPRRILFLPSSLIFQWIPFHGRIFDSINPPRVFNNPPPVSPELGFRFPCGLSRSFAIFREFGCARFTSTQFPLSGGSAAGAVPCPLFETVMARAGDSAVLEICSMLRGFWDSVSELGVVNAELRLIKFMKCSLCGEIWVIPHDVGRNTYAVHLVPNTNFFYFFRIFLAWNCVSSFWVNFCFSMMELFFRESLFYHNVSIFGGIFIFQ